MKDFVAVHKYVVEEILFMFLKGIKCLYHQNKHLVAFHDTAINVHFPLAQSEETPCDLKLNLFPYSLCLQISLSSQRSSIACAFYIQLHLYIYIQLPF